MRSLRIACLWTVCLLASIALLGCGGDDGNNDPQGGDITVLAPNGGESLKVGEAVSIRWDCIESIKDVTIALSLDNGSTFLPAKIADTVDDQSSGWKNLSWTPSADQVGDSCLLRIYDYNDTNNYDHSDQTFTVSP